MEGKKISLRHTESIKGCLESSFG
uniref:Uncharacterized protein n=1 Tax=Lepeophtheirus salmonis TaxID=72036 RepID=A0A0K2V2D4_LEPSM